MRAAWVVFVLAATLAACSAKATVKEEGETVGPRSETATSAQAPARGASPASAPAAATATEIATFGAGCFWCVEAVLEELDGVLDARSGYMGGPSERPTYRDVCSGETGHAEVVQVKFDPSRISYATLLDWFWKLHDPTTPDRQGPDAGTQYRSAVFVHSDAQRAVAEKSRAAAGAGFRDPIVTEITEAAAFWPAEEYHQDYFRKNPNQGYCEAMIAPKLEKLGLK